MDVIYFSLFSHSFNDLLQVLISSFPGFYLVYSSLADLRGARTIICLEGMDSGLSSLEVVVNVGKLLTSMSHFLYLRNQNSKQ